MAKNKENKNMDNVNFINMPIESADEDKVGILQCALELKSVIRKGAQSVAVTSGFGGGKSSLIRYLESLYCGIFTKFCYVNLWSQFNSNAPEELHKSFLYQLANQINVKRGNYVSRRLSPNYGMLGITLPSRLTSFLSFVMVLLLVAGFACTTFYDELSKWISIKFFDTHHNKLGVVCFVAAVLFALMFIYKTDIIFSSARSETNRTIDEHELMDIYRTHICKFHFRHYIVVIEDLDRSEQKRVNQFIKELRRYYIPYKHKSSNCPVIRWLKNHIFNNVNRITFIVNIKEENEIADKDDIDLFSKAFDYVLNLKNINIDNYDVILNKLLEEHREYFKNNNIPAFDKDDKLIPEFEWIIRGQKIGIREIKRRLNATISTYVNLCSKFNRDNISLKKCIAAAYITTAFEKEYLQIRDLGFDSIIDLYVTNPQMTEEDIAKDFENKNRTVKISSAFAEDVKTLIENGLIDFDYRQYFFNFPSDSYMRSDKQNRLNAIILYDRDISSNNEFDQLVVDVIRSDHMVIIDAFDRLKRLGKHFPFCVLHNKELFDLALRYDSEMVWLTLSEKLQYDNETIARTSRLVVEIVKRNLINNQSAIDQICSIVSAKATARSIITFRKHLIEHLGQDILKFKSLFFEERPLITKSEIASLGNNENLLALIDLKSSELDMDLVATIHMAVLTRLDLAQAYVLDSVADYYERLYDVLGQTENETLTTYMFEIINITKVIHPKLEAIIIENNKFEDVKERYVGMIGLADHCGEISPNTLRYINDLGITSNIPESVCLKLKAAGWWKAFIVNSVETDIKLINFSEAETIAKLKEIDFTDEKDKTVSIEKLIFIRTHILRTMSPEITSQYKYLFLSPNPIITNPEICIIINKKRVLSFVDAKQVDEKNCLYIAAHLTKTLCDLNDSNDILCFVGELDDVRIKRTFFCSLDFDKIQYYRISIQRQKNIVRLMSSAFDFSDVEEQLEYMTKTKCSNSDFEKQIKKSILEGSFSNLEQEYANYVRLAKRTTYETVGNLCLLNHSYAMPHHILEKMFAAKKYTRYVLSKILAERAFVVEKDRIDILWSAYESIYLSANKTYDYVQSVMADNTEFVAMMIEKERYVDTPPRNRKLFAKALQTTRSLQDLFENYANDFIIEYLSTSNGFISRDAAVCFIALLRKNPKVAASESVYENNYHKLVDSSLKSNLTKCHNAAKGL